MNELDLIRSWDKAWMRIIVAQLAPTGLLITTVALLQFGLAAATAPVRWAALLILLASGILGALAEFGAAHEAAGVAKHLQQVAPDHPTTAKISQLARLLPIVKYLTPAIFVAIFLALAVALLGA